MALRASYRYSLFRDLPPAFVLFSCAAAVVSLFMFFFPYLYSAQESETRPGLKKLGLEFNKLSSELNEFNFDKHYAGEIITRFAGEIVTGSNYEDDCRKLIFDNRNGNMWDKGQVACNDMPYQPSQKNRPEIGKSPRLREISNAFRQGDSSARAPH